jgi:hypothetical protein
MAKFLGIFSAFFFLVGCQTPHPGGRSAFRQLYESWAAGRRPAAVRTFDQGEVALYFIDAQSLILKICSAKDLSARDLDCPESQGTETVRIPLKVFKKALKDHLELLIEEGIASDFKNDSQVLLAFAGPGNWRTAPPAQKRIYLREVGLRMVNQLMDTATHDLSWQESALPKDRLLFQIFKKMTLIRDLSWFQRNVETFGWGVRKDLSLLQKAKELVSPPQIVKVKNFDFQFSYIYLVPSQDEELKLCNLLYPGFKCTSTQKAHVYLLSDFTAATQGKTFEVRPSDINLFYAEVLNDLDEEHSYRVSTPLESKLIYYQRTAYTNYSGQISGDLSQYVPLINPDEVDDAQADDFPQSLIVAKKGQLPSGAEVRAHYEKFYRHH